VEPFTGSGKACEYVEEICRDLHERGYDGAAQELQGRAKAVLEAAGTIILPKMCKGDPDEIAECSEHFGLTPVFDSDALRVHVMAFLGSLGLMAEYVEGICDDLKQSDGQGGGAVPTPAPASALSGEARALAALTDHADWTDTKIAEAAGVNRTTLYTYPRFVQARALLRANGPTSKDRRRGRTRKRLPDTLPDT